MSCEEHQLKRTKAIELRLAGYSRRESGLALGMSGRGSVQRWLEGVPVPESLRRARAKDDLRERARAMRREGASYREIVKELGVSISSCSLWLRDIELTPEQRQRLFARGQAGREVTAAKLRARRERKVAALKAEASAQIGAVSRRDLFIAGVIAYWAEGAKAKPWYPSAGMQFCNSDPGMIKLYLRWLDLLEIEEDRRVYRIAIHERADICAATRFWADLVGVPEERFRRPTLKRHNPKTVRRKVGTDYVGCLTITVLRGLEMNRRIAGWFEGIVESMGASVNAASTGSFEVPGAGSTPARPASRAATEISPARSQRSRSLLNEPTLFDGLGRDSWA